MLGQVPFCSVSIHKSSNVLHMHVAIYSICMLLFIAYVCRYIYNVCMSLFIAYVCCYLYIIANSDLA